jgi:DNA polymerase-1
MRKVKRVYLDTETTGLDPRKDKLVSVQVYAPGAPGTTILDVRHLRGWQDYLTVALDGALVVGHNLKFDLQFLARAGVFFGNVWDTMLGEQVLHGVGMKDARLRGLGLNLKDTALRYGTAMSKEERNWFIDLDTRPDEWLAPFPVEQVAYMEADVTCLPHIAQVQSKHLKVKDLLEVAKLEMRVLPALVDMELAGIRVDVDGWRSFIANKQLEANELEAQALVYLAYPMLFARAQEYDKSKAAGGKPSRDTSLPNIGSTKQLLQGFEGLGVTLESTSSATLTSLAEHVGEASQAAEAVLKYRKAVKFVQSFGESLLARVATDGRIHPDYRQIGASTGRMSCTNPNWQQVPSKGDGKQLRALVIPDKGNVLVTADFSNIEWRIVAAYSQDKAAIEMLSKGLDMHSEMAYRLFGLDRSVDVRKAEAAPGWSYRETAKMLNYGLVYGMSSMRLARSLKVQRPEAQAIMDSYFKQLPGIRKWLDAAAKSGEQLGYVWTKSGRIRLLDSTFPGQAKRQAMNTPIQGTSADVTKLAVALWHEQHPDYARLVAVVHDELVVECPRSVSRAAAKRLEDAMDEAQREYVKLPKAALPRPVAKVSEHWEH